VADGDDHNTVRWRCSSCSWRSIASMPIKCMAHTPMPIAIPPPASQTRAATPSLPATRAAIFSAVYAARMATTKERIQGYGCIGWLHGRFYSSVGLR
jgi:hypothetical protein